MSKITIGIIYEITGNPYFSEQKENYSNKLSEFVYPSEINDICEAITKLGYDFEIIDGAKDLNKRATKLKQKCSLFFNKSIGFKGLERKLIVPAISLLHELPLVGSSAYAMTLARHKYHTNMILRGMGFRVPFAYYCNNILDIPNNIIFPVIVKPNQESDSLGITQDSICSNMNDLTKQVNKILTDFKQPVIIEEYISGEEWKVSVIGNGKEAIATGCVTVMRNNTTIKGSLQTRDDIVNRKLSHSIPSSHNRLLEEAYSNATNIHNLLGLSDYSRCDFRISKTGKLICMEVSTHPYLSSNNSSFIKASIQKYENYNNVINEIIQAGQKRLFNCHSKTEG